MDEKTTISQLKDSVKKFCEDRDWDQYHNPKDLAIGIITESSELLEYFRFKNKKEVEGLFKTSSKKKIAEEISDILFFIFRLAQKYDIDISEEFKDKIQKNEKRYPIEKSKGSNKKYVEFEQ
jgi:NTP pyrophosphatase (non-canonical NTP hydrolase)